MARARRRVLAEASKSPAVATGGGEEGRERAKERLEEESSRAGWREKQGRWLAICGVYSCF